MIRRRIYYDNRTGLVITHIPEQINVNGVRETTIDEDFESIIKLQDVDRNFVGVLDFKIGEFNQDFLESDSYRVNLETRQIEFSYPDPNKPEADPVYRAPISEQVEKLEVRTKATEDAVLALLMGGMM